MRRGFESAIRKRPVTTTHIRMVLRRDGTSIGLSELQPRQCVGLALLISFCTPKTDNLFVMILIARTGRVARQRGHRVLSWDRCRCTTASTPKTASWWSAAKAS